MSYILVENLSKTIFSKVLFDSIGFGIDAGEKVALVAKNGTGKSTLLKVLAGKEVYDSGTITFQKGIKLAYLAQEPLLDPTKTIEEEIFGSDATLLKVVKEYEASLDDANNHERMQAAFEAMNKHDAWGYEAQIHEILDTLKLTELKGKIETLSGGQRKRLALAKVLIDKADVLILDEPTNHLDLEMIEWLEKFLMDQNITLLMVTHDRYFLDRVCNQILELDKGKIYKHKGNYEYYLDKKSLRQSSENLQIDKTREFLRREAEWVKKSPQGRQTKSSARVDAFHELKAGVGQKHVTEKVELDVVGSRMGGKILELFNLTKSFGDKVILDKFNYKFKKGEKIGIIGPNGVGKSTFLNIIMGLENPDSGNIVQGETIRFGYYSQHQNELNDQQKVIESVREISNVIKLSDGSELSASKMLERFLFTPIEQQNLVSKLSGGERKRLSLLRILMTNPNFLILDEPTNDFDLMSLEVLEEFLHNFKGCLIIISHDRYFVDNIVDHLFVFKGNGQIQDFPGNYSHYRLSETSSTAVNVSSRQKPQPTSTKQANEIYQVITKLEKKRDKLKAKMFELGDKYEEVAKVHQECQILEQELTKLGEQWLELST